MRLDGEAERHRELRAGYLEKFMLPVSARIFALSPAVEAVVVAFAPSPRDTVSEVYIPVFTPEPEWPTCLLANPKQEGKGAVFAADIAWAATDEFLREADIAWLEENFDEARAAFLPFVPVGVPDIEALESFALYAVVRRTPGPTATVVGKVQRLAVSPLASSSHARVARLPARWMR